MKSFVSLIFTLTLAMFATSAIAGGDIAAGEVLAADCAGCHGTAGEGGDGTPAIAGLDFAEHVAMLKGYKNGSREGMMMQMFSAELSEEDMKNIAAYYASLKD